MKIFLNLFWSFFIALALAGCTKNVLDYGDTVKLTGDEALLKVNYVSYYYNNRAVAIKINDKRVSSVITARTPFPGGGYNTGGSSTADFLAVTPGNLKLSIILPKKKDDGTDSLVLYSTTLQIVGGKNYVAHITDTTSNTKTVLTEENFARPDTAYCKYRFINLMPNVPAVDLYYGTSATDNSLDSLIAGNVSYLNITNEIKLRAAQSKTWKIRPAGAAITTATVLANYTSASTFLNQRVYTIFASGYSGISTAPRRPYVSFFLIR
ncbi:DUF4397 domain-containing protein [Pedobacter sp. BMA]|uniref:DUF4397 domain-containing protein n=1 Tax=Pedobacter sp. BMA TaxID=1663685 RepID=UPI00064AEF15|nr:DUF4397 domain-containing protein [Pedobacter sp. BMA]KLT64508.1 hypothetical protein AB669_12100 [Pedobacter sp. BMA]